MAVVPMQKVQIVVHRDNTDALLSVLQQKGAIELTEITTGDLGAAEVVFPHAHLLPRVQHAVAFLAPYEAKKSLWRTLRDGTQTELSEIDIIKQAAETQQIKVNLQQIYVM